MSEVTEKGAAAPVVEDHPAENESHDEKPSKSSIEDDEEHVPHLHAKTFLVVFAVCLIYFAQLINVVGAGAVSLHIPPLSYHLTFNSVLKISLRYSVNRPRVSGWHLS